MAIEYNCEGGYEWWRREGGWSGEVRIDHAVVRDVWTPIPPRVSQGGVYEGLTDPIHSTANIQLANKSSDAQEGKSASLTHPAPR